MSQVRRTSPLQVALVVTGGLALGSLVRPIAVRLEGSAPRPGWTAAALLLLLAVAVGGVAWSTWQSLHRRKQRMVSDFAIRLLALAKACVVVGALFAGGYAGLALSFVDDWDTTFGRDRVLQGGAAAVAAVLVLVAALLLERALRVPGAEDDEDDVPPGTATT